jgi:hypothetical protein
VPISEALNGVTTLSVRYSPSTTWPMRARSTTEPLTLAESTEMIAGLQVVLDLTGDERDVHDLRRAGVPQDEGALGEAALRLVDVADQRLVGPEDVDVPAGAVAAVAKNVNAELVEKISQLHRRAPQLSPLMGQSYHASAGAETLRYV